MTLAATRMGDSIEHTGALAGLVNGLLAGVCIALVGLIVVASGGTAIPALLAYGTVAVTAAAGAGIGELRGSMKSAPAGKIATGTPNVLINSLPAVRAGMDLVLCDKHFGPSVLVAVGSDSVLINDLSAVRESDTTACSAKIGAGSLNVFFGGGPILALGVEIEPEVPLWLRRFVGFLELSGTIALSVNYLGAAVGWFRATLFGVGEFAFGEIVGAGVSKASTAIFGDDSNVPKWFMIAWSIIDMGSTQRNFVRGDNGLKVNASTMSPTPRKGMAETPVVDRNGHVVIVYGQPNSSSKTPGHAPAISTKAYEMAYSGQYKYVLMQRGWGTATGGLSGSRAIPDVVGVRNDGKVDAFEVMSKSDNYDDLMERLTDGLNTLPSEMQGAIDVLPPTP